MSIPNPRGAKIDLLERNKLCLADYFAPNGQDDENQHNDVIHEEGLDVPRGKRCPALEEDEENVANKPQVGAEAPGGCLEWQDVGADVLCGQSHSETKVIKGNEAPCVRQRCYGQWVGKWVDSQVMKVATPVIETIQV